MKRTSHKDWSDYMAYSISGEMRNINFLLNQYKDIVRNDDG